ncbi:predicted protein [Verticillium alfalfae VaMs.102]|uniref:Predicted protein n=1 Tax=Verticillium alfalfae (strain VaMs.102 / ATCC MYA-4576 / FGSC 10136) TaxID=526221 RepID=C9SGN8_VERA1|nr:predicted protein [Verticillium alfalfae VaMs.102]EEY18160.1 predicted protein [Verticillium alfalfae VaMs.102]
MDQRTESSVPRSPGNQGEGGQASPDHPDEGILDRKRPITGVTTSFTSGFSRKQTSTPASGATPISTSTVMASRKEASSKTSNTDSSHSYKGDRKPSNASGKPAVRDIVSWLEHKKPIATGMTERPLRKFTPTSSYSGQEPSSKSLPANVGAALAPSRYNENVPAIVAVPSPPTCVPGTEEDSLTMLTYQEFFANQALGLPSEDHSPDDLHYPCGMTSNSRVYGIKHESSGRDVPSFSNGEFPHRFSFCQRHLLMTKVPGDSAAEAKANIEWQIGKMEWVRGHLDMPDEEVNRNAEKRAIRSGEKKLIREATISNRALAAAHSDHANRGSHALFPPITDDTMVWRDRRVAGSLVRAPQDDSDSDEFRFDNMYGFRSGAAYSSPIPAPLRLPSRQHQPELPLQGDQQVQAGEIAIRPLCLRKPITSNTNAMASSPDFGHADPIASSAIQTTHRAFLDNDDRLDGPSQGFHPNLDNGKADWKFPRNYTGSASRSSESSSTKAPQPAEETPHPQVNNASNHHPIAARSSCRTSWDAMTIQEKLRVLDAFFDNDAPIGSHLPPLIKEQQILYDEVFAKVLAVPSEHAETPQLKAERDAARAKNKAAGDRISSAYHDSMRRLLPHDHHQVAFPHQSHSFCPADGRKEATETLGVSHGGPKTAVDTTRMNSESWRDHFRGTEPPPGRGPGSEPRRRLEGVPPCPTRRAPVVPREGGRRFRRALTEPPNPPTAYDWS